MQQIRVDVLGVPQVSRMVMAPADNSRDFSRSWQLVFREFERITAQQFASQGSAMGTPWAPRVSGGSWPLLDKTGALKGSFTSGGQGHVSKVSHDSAEWGSSVNYAGYLHGGTSRMPARTLFTLDESRRRRVAAILMAGLFADSGGRVRAPSGRFAALGFP